MWCTWKSDDDQYSMTSRVSNIDDLPERIMLLHIGQHVLSDQ
jgi:hypothetical protein